MTLRERFWATRLLTCVSNSNEDYPWIIYFLGKFLILNNKKSKYMRAKFEQLN